MIQFSVVHNYKNKLRKNGTGLIQIRAYTKGQCKFFSTGIYVTPFQWSKRLKQVIDHPNTFQYNAEIRRQINALEAFALDCIKKNGVITINQVEDFFRYEDVESFTDFWRCELAADTKLSKETKGKHKAALNHWTDFRKDVQFSELNFNLIHDFDTFLYKKNLHTNTVFTHHKQVRKYINLAISKGSFEAHKNPYLKFKPKTVATERLVLVWEEVERLEALSFSPKESYLELIRDMFLFSCYTGLRFSDACNIQHQNIEQEKEGLLLNIIAQKTGKQLLLPLYKLHLKKPEQLIQKHLISGAAPHVLVFHQYTNQYFNQTLKLLAARAGINKAISSHVARHTFATHLASKIPLHVLKSILQHSKIETTMIYLHLSNKVVNDALDGVDW
ncbi:site-specific integrase [Aureispira sp. CCB-QB1]|uniref:site-specific integrase n=1 Tax=Aureispira sp. CCB-QB1 TaxID=1313421 RepID=UPI0006965A78|nr:site-specific integrase [Aureispira sp. CCB-QB1]